jgi:hypothetical protein
MALSTYPEAASDPERAVQQRTARTALRAFVRNRTPAENACDRRFFSAFPPCAASFSEFGRFGKTHA